MDMEGRGGRKGGALTPPGWGVPGLLNEYRGGQGQAVWLDGENRDAEKGFMGNGPRVSWQGWGWELVHQSQVSGWETPVRGGEAGEEWRAEVPGRVANPRMQGGEGRTGFCRLGPGCRPASHPRREFIMARIASGEGVGSCLGSLSISV